MIGQALLLFVCTFGIVFALSLQSLNVMGGHRLLAFLTSFAIGGFNLVLLKVVPQPTEWFSNVAYLTGGPMGVLAAMASHPFLIRCFGRKSPPIC